MIYMYVAARWLTSDKQWGSAALGMLCSHSKIRSLLIMMGAIARMHEGLRVTESRISRGLEPFFIRRRRQLSSQRGGVNYREVVLSGESPAVADALQGLTTRTPLSVDIDP